LGTQKQIELSTAINELFERKVMARESKTKTTVPIPFGTMGHGRVYKPDTK
jgi:hypothetical protein